MAANEVIIELINHRGQDLILGAIEMTDAHGKKYERGPITVKPDASHMMNRAEFKFYDTVAMAEMVENFQVDIQVDGKSVRAQPSRAKAPAAKSVSAMEPDETAESRALASILGDEPKPE